MGVVDVTLTRNVLNGIMLLILLNGRVSKCNHNIEICRQNHKLQWQNSYGAKIYSSLFNTGPFILQNPWDMQNENLPWIVNTPS